MADYSLWIEEGGKSTLICVPTIPRNVSQQLVKTYQSESKVYKTHASVLNMGKVIKLEGLHEMGLFFLVHTLFLRCTPILIENAYGELELHCRVLL